MGSRRWSSLAVVAGGRSRPAAPPGPRLLADRILLRLPVVGALLREVLAARFTRVLGTLLVNGVSLITALGIVRDALGNRAAVAAVEQATTSARGGGGLAQPTGGRPASSRRAPSTCCASARRTRSSAPWRLRAAEIHEERTRLATQRLVALLVPAITILMGVAVGGHRRLADDGDAQPERPGRRLRG